MARIDLESDALRLSVDPEIGGTVLRLDLRREGGWVPLLRPSPVPLGRSSNGASFTLAPYSNRIRDGVFIFEGRRYTLRHPEKHAIHGDVRDRPWRVVRNTSSLAELEIRSADFADFNFPFALSCAVRFELQGTALTMALRLRNESSGNMPAGLGFHPYFQRALVPGENVALGLAVSGVYPGETPLPTGPPVPVTPAQDFSRLRPLDVTLDHCFAGWNGRALLRWPTSDVTLHVEAGPDVSHVILYSPPGEPFFALEPVTNSNDGFNAFANGEAGTGVAVLAPGETLALEVRLALAP